MNRWLIISLVLAFSCKEPENLNDCERNFVGKFVNGHKSGHWRFFHNCKLTEEGNFNDGFRVGQWIHYFQNGVIESITFYSECIDPFIYWEEVEKDQKEVELNKFDYDSINAELAKSSTEKHYQDSIWLDRYINEIERESETEFVAYSIDGENPPVFLNGPAVYFDSLGRMTKVITFRCNIEVKRLVIEGEYGE